MGVGIDKGAGAFFGPRFQQSPRIFPISCATPRVLYYMLRMDSRERGTPVECMGNVKLEQPCPFDEWVHTRISLANQGIPKELHCQPFLAWLTLRSQETYRNPFFSREPTGFEGFYANGKHTAESVFKELLDHGRSALRSVRNSFAYDARQRGRVLRTLTELKPTTEGMLFWNDLFGVLLAKHRMLLQSEPVARFRSQTYLRLGIRDTITVASPASHLLVESCQLPIFGSTTLQDPLSWLSTLTEEDRVAWTIISRVGMFADPLVRQAIASLRW